MRIRVNVKTGSGKHATTAGGVRSKKTEIDNALVSVAILVVVAWATGAPVAIEAAIADEAAEVVDEPDKAGSVADRMDTVPAGVDRSL